MPEPIVPTGGPSEWILGCGINIAGQLVVNFGTNIMKYSHVRNAQKPLESQVSTLHQSLWWLGLAVFAAGNACNFVSLSFAPQVLLSTLSSVQLVSNVFWGRCLLRETVTASLLWATCLMFLGQVTAVSFASHRTRHYDSKTLESLYSEGPFRAYCVVLALTVAATWVVQRVLVVPRPHSRVSRRLAPVCFALLSTMVGSSSVMLAKSSSVLLIESLRGVNQFRSAFTYAVFAAWASVTMFWMYRFNSGLQRFEGVYIVPLMQVLWTVFAIVSGGIYFQEFDAFTTRQILGFTGGVLVIVAGVYVLASSAGQSQGGPGRGGKLDHRLSIDSDYASGNANSNSAALNGCNSSVQSDFLTASAVVRDRRGAQQAVELQLIGAQRAAEGVVNASSGNLAQLPARVYRPTRKSGGLGLGEGSSASEAELELAGTDGGFGDEYEYEYEHGLDLERAIKNNRNYGAGGGGAQGAGGAGGAGGQAHGPPSPSLTQAAAANRAADAAYPSGNLPVYSELSPVVSSSAADVAASVLLASDSDASKSGLSAGGNSSSSSGAAAAAGSSSNARSGAREISLVLPPPPSNM